MFLWIMYDVAAQKRLKRVASLCHENGFRRIQKSVYLGQINQEEAIRLREDILRVIQPKQDRVLMLPVTKQCLQSAAALGADCGLMEILDPPAIVFI